VLDRTLLIRSTTPMTNVQVIPLDLERTDGNTVLPASAIAVQPRSAQPLQSGGEWLVPLRVDLRQAPWSGEFAGKLLLTYTGGEQFYPLAIRVKDAWELPLLVLLLGTGLGMGVSAYRSRGKPRDEVLVRVGQLRAQIENDREFSRAMGFQQAIEASLIDVNLALQRQQWETAQTAMQQAETLWTRWLKGRSDWLTQLAYGEILKQHLQRLDANLPYAQTVQQDLEDALRDLPELEGPDQLRDRLQELGADINRHIRLESKMHQLGELIAQAPEGQAVLWQGRMQGMQQEMVALQPPDLKQEQNLLTQVDAAIAEVTQLVYSQPGQQGVKQVGLVPPATPLLVAPAPTVRALIPDGQISNAGKRLRWFTQASYAIALLFLAGAGFNELYVDRPTFGANPWRDYFSLLAWGFGAEATRDAVTRVMQGWGVPGSKEK
jgi:hypothetical protein